MNKNFNVPDNATEGLLEKYHQIMDNIYKSEDSGILTFNMSEEEQDQLRLKIIKREIVFRDKDGNEMELDAERDPSVIKLKRKNSASSD